MPKKVVVLVPTYNEINTLKKVVELILEQQSKLKNYDLNVLIVDSHSPDGTWDLAKKLAEKNKKIHFLDFQERGFGLAVIKGSEYAFLKLKADILMQLDADLQHDPNEIPQFLDKIDEGFDFVQGSRYIKGGANNISPIRQLFSIGSSLVLRLLTGVFLVNDFTPSYKAYTRQLYEKLNIDSIPWEGTTFLVQPATVVEAARAGAKITQVPIRFKNREVDKSKNEVFNYVLDVLGYGIEVRLSKHGIRFPVLYWARRSKTFIKFGTVGFMGTLVDFIFYNLFIANFGIRPATAKAISTEIAILNNFTLNNLWTFKKRKTKNNIWQKFFIFNLVSLGGLSLSVLIVKILHTIYGDGVLQLSFLKIAYYNLYFFATIPVVMIWNFVMNHFFTWKKEDYSPERLKGVE